MGGRSIEIDAFHPTCVTMQGRDQRHDEGEGEWMGWDGMEGGGLFYIILYCFILEFSEMI